jgi:hypothetical protein
MWEQQVTKLSLSHIYINLHYMKVTVALGRGEGAKQHGMEKDLLPQTVIGKECFIFIYSSFI